MVDTIHLGVVGKNISYSQSPFIHKAFAQDNGITLSYTIVDVGESLLTDKITMLREAGFLGCNITVPFKEEAFNLADHHTERARQAQAANTFLFKNGHIFADNTDGAGLVRDLTHNLGLSITGKRILICGAGGAVRGILGPLLAQKPHEIILVNRDFHKAKTLETDFASPLLSARQYAEISDLSVDLMIDGTALKTALLPLPVTLQFNPGGYFYDLKYQAISPTREWAIAKGAITYDGIGMLVEQAAEAFYFWTGIQPKTGAILETLKCASA
jgi:shikimate dehydrogenase